MELKFLFNNAKREITLQHFGVETDVTVSICVGFLLFLGICAYKYLCVCVCI